MNTMRRANKKEEEPRSRIDVARVKAATEVDIARWKRDDGVDDATVGPARFVRAGPDVRGLREHLGLSQEAFAERFHISLRTIQEWEQRRRVPDGPARNLLKVIEQEPDAAARALAASD